jgi:rubrerythrin
LRQAREEIETSLEKYTDLYDFAPIGYVIPPGVDKHHNLYRKEETTMNILECAIKMEVEARMFFEKLAETTAVPELKNLFTMLAESEQEHHNALVGMKEKIDFQKIQFKEWQPDACLFKPLLAKRDLTVDMMEESDQYLQIIEEEQKGISFYDELAAQTKDEETRKILLLIADEERKHLSIVKNIYSFVESPKNFLVNAEFSNLKEY